MTIIETTAPASPNDEPLTVAEAKTHLVVEFDADDTYIEGLIAVVHEQAKQITNRAILASTWKYYLDDFPKNGLIELPRGKVSSVTSVKYMATIGTYTTVSSTLYEVDILSQPARIRSVAGSAWPVPDTAMNAIVVEYVAGWATPAAIPPTLKHAMLFHLSHYYEIRQPVIVGTVFSRIPYTIEALYAPHRIPYFP